MKVQKLSQDKIDQYVKRYRTLTHRQGELDFDMAKLAHELRNEFVTGASGDYSFRKMVVNEFGAGAPAAAKLLKAAKSLKLVKTRTAWSDLGGWSSITFLMNLPQNGKRKVLNKALDVAHETGRPTNLGRVRAIAFNCNVRSLTNGGRPLRRETEERLEIVSHYLTRLYKTQPHLPAIPEVVTKALKEARVPVAALAKIDQALPLPPRTSKPKVAQPVKARPKLVRSA